MAPPRQSALSKNQDRPVADGWEPLHLVRAYRLAQAGLDEGEIAETLGVDSQEFTTWLHDADKGLAEAIDYGRREVANEDNQRFPGMSDNQRRFLVSYSLCGVVTKACEASQVSATAHSKWMRQPEYKSAFLAADQEARDHLLIECRRRAVHGLVRQKFHSGRPIMVSCEEGDPEGRLIDGRWKKPYVEHYYSDSLLSKMLEAYHPEFRGKVEHTHAHDVKSTILSDLLELAERSKEPEVIDVEYTKRIASEIVEGNGDG